jgi:isocitrate/isopropylmalate dehydrogenase
MSERLVSVREVVEDTYCDGQRDEDETCLPEEYEVEAIMHAGNIPSQSIEEAAFEGTKKGEKKEVCEENLGQDDKTARGS